MVFFVFDPPGTEELLGGVAIHAGDPATVLFVGVAGEDPPYLATTIRAAVEEGVIVRIGWVEVRTPITG